MTTTRSDAQASRTDREWAPSIDTASGWFLALLDAIGSGRDPVNLLRQCPAHADAGPSLSIADGSDGRALVRCFAGCPTIGDQGVLDALRVPARWLYRPPHASPEVFARACLGHLTFPPIKLSSSSGLAAAGYRHESYHEYGDSQWRKERLRRASDGDKAVRWEARNPDGEWVPGLLGRRERTLPLYRERDLRPALAAGEPILLVESESSVDALCGWYASTWCGGAGSVYVATLRRVLLEHEPLIVIPDNDQPGLRAAERVRAALPQALTLLGEPGEDARDLYRRYGDVAFRRAVEQIAAATPGRAA